MKELLICVGVLALGIVLTIFGGDFRMMIMGVIPISSKLIGILAIVIGALGALLCIGSLKKK